MRLLSVLGASHALSDHLVRHPEQWRELTDPLLGSTRPAAFAVRAGLLRSVGADPDAASPTAAMETAEAVDALRVEYRRVLLRLASRDLTHGLGVDDAAAELSDLAAGTLEAALGDRPPGGGGGGRPGAPRGDRDGQVRRARAQLRLRRRRDLRARAGRRRGRHRRHPCRHPAGVPPHPRLLRPDRRGHPVAGRRRAASRGQGRPAEPDPGQPPRLLRALGPDLGVPGPAQGATGGRRPGARSRSTSRWSPRWCGGPPSGRGSSPTPRRCAGGCSSTSRPATPTASSSWARAGCATSSSPSSCSSWCTAAPTGRSAPARPSPRWPT